MGDRRRRTTRALLGGLGLLVVLGAAPAAAAPADCGGGTLELLQAQDAVTVTGVRITDIGAACDGQPVGVQFLGNPEGDPALPADELARSYSDEDPCTGEDLASGGVLVDGAIDVLLCEGAAAAGHVDGHQLTRMRLLTTADAAPAAGSDPPDAAPDPDPPADPAPSAPDGDLPRTGADILRAAALGALAVLAGVALVRLARGRPLVHR